MTNFTFQKLRSANLARQDEWCPDQKPDLSFRGNELAGETGEACNIIKKIERERHGWAGSRATLEELASELADIIITTDLVAASAGIDLGAAVVKKFNATSDKVGLFTKITEHVDLTRDHCVSCSKMLEPGDLVYVEHGEGGYICADCTGDNPESFVGEDGEPLKPGEPIPAPMNYE